MVCGHLVTQDFPIPGEVSEGHRLTVEQPEVISWQQQCRCTSARKPPDVLSCSDELFGVGPLEPNIVGHGLRNDPEPAHDFPCVHVGTHQGVPRPPPLCFPHWIKLLAGEPLPEPSSLYVSGVDITHFKMDRIMVERGDEIVSLVSCYRLHAPPSADSA